MSLPTTVFIDTSVFRGNQYNFSSVTLSSFAEVGREHKLTLLLPQPIDDEIQRHLAEASRKAVDGLRTLLRKAPYLAKLRAWNPELVAENIADTAMETLLRNEWKEFLKGFEVKKVGYEDVSIERIMNWYNWELAPFGKGSKRKEFPDAFAFAAVAAYAEKNNESVAVISHDNDLKAACSREPRMLYFSILPKLTEQLLKQSHDIDAFEKALADRDDEMTEIVGKILENSLFRNTDREYDLIETEVEEVVIDDTSVVAVGEKDCFFTFYGTATIRGKYQWEDYPDPDGRTFDLHGSVSESVEISGEGKLILPETAEESSEITRLELDSRKYMLRRRPSVEY